MIVSFATKQTEAIWQRRQVKRIAPDLQRRIRIKLLMLDAAQAVEELKSPPGNRLEKLSGDRSGTYSIRVNQQWRICFRYTDGKAEQVELIDYH